MALLQDVGATRQLCWPLTEPVPTQSCRGLQEAPQPRRAVLVEVLPARDEHELVVVRDPEALHPLDDGPAATQG